MKVTTREKELLQSEKRNIYNTVEIDLKNPNILKVMWGNTEVGRLMLEVNRIDWAPTQEGFDIDLDITNITPLKDNWE